MKYVAFLFLIVATGCRDNFMYKAIDGRKYETAREYNDHMAHLMEMSYLDIDYKYASGTYTKYQVDSAKLEYENMHIIWNINQDTRRNLYKAGASDDELKDFDAKTKRERDSIRNTPQ